MLTPPRRSVTRFFIPLIDVLILLFCIFLLMPYVSPTEGESPETPPVSRDAEAGRQESQDAAESVQIGSYRYTLNHRGAMLGWEMSPDQLGALRPAHNGAVRNLHFVGHWTQPGGGITPVIVSAMQVAKKIIESDSTCVELTRSESAHASNLSDSARRLYAEAL